MMKQVKVSIRHHRAPSIPTALADYVYSRHVERVRCAHDGANVQIVLPVLDSDVKRCSLSVQVGNNSFH
jgi:hypothetical protein